MSNKLDMPLNGGGEGGAGAGAPNDEQEGDAPPEMGYQQTLMYGRYSRSLGDYAKEEAKRQKLIEKRRRRAVEKRRRELEGEAAVDTSKRGAAYACLAKAITSVWKHTFAKIGEDWVFLCVLGVLMACVSFLMDYGIDTCNTSRLWLYRHLGDHMALQYLAWTTLPVFLVLFSAGFVHVVAPQAIGSGIPEMKTILRGVVLKEYLSGKTLIAKAVGLTATLGSGMPLGKEGPFVHIASIVATSLSKLVTSFQGIYANESRNSEMLAAACAVGVACCFGSPIGGVLFSIEVTSVYFAVRNYWRGFFAAVCGAMAFRLIAIWFEEEETIVAVFMTGFKMEFPYDPQELFVFALIGVFCGLGGALYVYTHRRYVLWMRGNKRLTRFLQKNRFIYPFLVSWLISTLSFPPFTGQFQAADISTHEQIHILFSNYTWSADPLDMTVDEWAHVSHWVTPYTDVFVNLTIYILMTFFLSIIAATLPVPTGVLIPTFKVGAAFGRLVGEAMHVWFPEGVRYGDAVSYIAPGGYATVGAAAFSGAVTHTISISVIVFEMTGQITHCVPVLIAVLISNAIASLLQPSCYDSIIMIKKLPYLPDILPASSGAYSLYVDDFMVRDIHYIWYGMTYRDLRQVLREGRKLRGFPLVDNPTQMVLLGSIQRTELIAAIERQLGAERRRRVAAERRDTEIRKRREVEARRREEQAKLQALLEEEAKKRKEDETKKKPQAETSEQQKQRRPSRFAVTTEGGDTFVPESVAENVAEGVQKKPLESPEQQSSIEEKYGLGLDPSSPAMRALKQLSSQPKKSILKKSNSYTIHSFGIPGLGSSPGPLRGGGSGHQRVRALRSDDQNQHHPAQKHNSSSSPYQTVTGAEARWRNAFGSIHNLFKRPSQLTLVSGAGGSSHHSPMGGSTADLTLEEQREWEEAEMDKQVAFDECHIDPAPFQLVEKTSLLKVHSLFSMLGVNHAYVTAIGRLIGVVGLKELRKAIEDANSGQQSIQQQKSVKEAQSSRHAIQMSVDSSGDFIDVDTEIGIAGTNSDTDTEEGDKLMSKA